VLSIQRLEGGGVPGPDTPGKIKIRAPHRS
jgi:hypothetical protein